MDLDAPTIRRREPAARNQHAHDVAPMIAAGERVCTGYTRRVQARCAAKLAHHHDDGRFQEAVQLPIPLHRRRRLERAAGREDGPDKLVIRQVGGQALPDPVVEIEGRKLDLGPPLAFVSQDIGPLDGEKRGGRPAAKSLTVTDVDEPSFPSFTVIDAAPSPRAVIKPEPSTVATRILELSNVACRVTSRGACWPMSPSTASC